MLLVSKRYFANGQWKALASGFDPDERSYYGRHLYGSFVSEK
jgi:hypothetical protein